MAKNTTQEIYNELKLVFESKADPEKAPLMAKYMWNQFAFYGIQTKDRQMCYREQLKQLKKRTLELGLNCSGLE